MKSTRPEVRFLSKGTRLHLQHGPIDLIIGADGERHAAFIKAQQRFNPILSELVNEMAALRQPFTTDTEKPAGATALRMHEAALPFHEAFLSRMICVAGAVADTVLAAMTEENIDRGYVNNGGDIALFLKSGQSFDTAIADHKGNRLGVMSINSDDKVGGIATSGRHGRSLSFGIADAVTVLAKDAATADVAATLIANAVDVPGHGAIDRRQAIEIDPNSELGQRLVVTNCGALSDDEAITALGRGFIVAEKFKAEGRIIDAALFLQGHSMILGNRRLKAVETKKMEAHA